MANTTGQWHALIECDTADAAGPSPCLRADGHLQGGLVVEAVSGTKWPYVCILLHTGVCMYAEFFIDTIWMFLLMKITMAFKKKHLNVGTQITFWF